MAGRPPSRVRLLRSIAIIDLGIFAIAGVVCWFIGWHTLRQYCDAVVLGGMFAISLGLWIFWQEWNLNRDFIFMHAQSMSDQDDHERVKLLRDDDDTGYQVFVHLFAAGFAAIGFGAAMQLLFASP